MRSQFVKKEKKNAPLTDTPALAGRDYGEFCVFPEEGEQESSLEEDSDDSRVHPEP